MKKLIPYILSLFLFFGCQQDDNSSFEGEGTLRLNVKMKSEIQVATRSLTESEEKELKKDCKVRIYDTDNLIRKYQGVDNVPTDIVLPSGEYRVRVTAGDSVAASFDKKFYEGIKSFAIRKGANLLVDVTCNIGNTVTKIQFDEESLNPVFKEYEVSIAVKAENGSLKFDPENTDQMGYFSIPTDCDTLFCTFKGTTIVTDDPYEHIDTIPFVKGATLYNLTYKYKELEVELPPTGGGMVKIEVDATPIGEPREESVVLYRRPVIKAEMNGQAIDLASPYNVETGVSSEVSVMVTSSSVLKQVELSSQSFPEFLNMTESSFDLKNLTAEQITALTSGGITIGTKEESKGYALGITFSNELMRKFTATDGTRQIQFRAVDDNGKERIINWQIIASNVSVQTEEIPMYDVWATKATLYGSVLAGREPQGKLSFRYCEKGTDEWKFVNAERNDTFITAKINGLKAGTEYQYQILEGEVASNALCSFTTEQTAQLPNSGFEDWYGSKPMYVATSDKESDIFWDSGNHGSSSVSFVAKDLTVKDTSLKMEGNYSAKLESKDMIMTLGAGNLFTGKFLDIENTTKGVLGWGRPFKTRPIAITGYVRYHSETVDKYNGDGKIPKGDKDKGYMFIALGDWKGEYVSGKYGSGTWPVVVRTKSESTLFDNQNPAIIAYGEKTWDDSTEGEQMYRFTIRLDYRSEKRVPTTIIVVASASKYGDYYAGAVGSTMWLDDLKLIYDESELTE